MSRNASSVGRFRNSHAAPPTRVESPAPAPRRPPPPPPPPAAARSFGLGEQSPLAPRRPAPPLVHEEDRVQPRERPRRLLLPGRAARVGRRQEAGGRKQKAEGRRQKPPDG